MIIYYVPRGGVAQRSILIEEPGSPKRYRRVWLDLNVGTDDWTWHLPTNAVQVWEGSHEDGLPYDDTPCVPPDAQRARWDA